MGASSVGGGSVAGSSVAGSSTTASASTVWLCMPGTANDPCAFTPMTTAVQATGARSDATIAGLPSAATASTFDCFYVYPTTSAQKTANANLVVQAGQVDAAIAEVSQFSQVCNVWAPMYRQATETSIEQGLEGSGARATSLLRSTFSVAYGSLLSSWKDFLAHDSDGRPIVLIGHSQGAAILIHLIATQFDHNPSLRHRLVMAIIAGGNLQVPVGKTVGATFAHVPICTAASQAGCVIAYSTFPSTPPANSLFGRPGQGVSVQSGQTAKKGQQVACVNPAALGGGRADLDPYFVSVTQKGLVPKAHTAWVAYPGLYSANCQSRDGATWLQVADVVAPGDTRPVVTALQGPRWGYHAYDVSLALGNLVSDVASAEASWASEQPS
ncbi:MAG TPA: DUF3089 domain-containing protein [Acidimicrobiales bacterium]|nr:DUF3089 domain-containing protein [Acidimicrobiales bacterium]